MIYPNNEEIRRAAYLLRRGELVAFPTETVYGLGGDATNLEAVDRIFRVKGRPATSPLIVHVGSVEMARELAAEWPAVADRAVGLWWPGPLTLVVRKRAAIPDTVTAGLDTVGLRMPAHPVALELIREAGVALAAPSANRFTELSPTTAEHVRQALGDRVAMVLDGGPCTVGIESTVVSVVAVPPVLLRPGMISRAELESVFGPLSNPGPIDDAHPAPGMHVRHYSPRTRVVFGECPAEGRGVVLGWHVPASGDDFVEMPREAERYAAVLYETLHRVDGSGYEWIAIEPPPDGVEWEGIRDRLRRAAG